MTKKPENPDRIWLDPICNEKCDGGRCWCSIPQDCPDCEEKAVEYIRADLVLKLREGER